jgi:hypothetical protein
VLEKQMLRFAQHDGLRTDGVFTQLSFRMTIPKSVILSRSEESALLGSPINFGDPKLICGTELGGAL